MATTQNGFGGGFGGGSFDPKDWGPFDPIDPKDGTGGGMPPGGGTSTGGGTASGGDISSGGTSSGGTSSGGTSSGGTSSGGTSSGGKLSLTDLKKKWANDTKNLANSGELDVTKVAAEDIAYVIDEVGAILQASTSLTYKTIDLFNDKVQEINVLTTRGIWGPSEGCNMPVIGSMFTFYTSSFQTDKQKEYYYNVFIDNTLDVCEYEFSVAYGHYNGLGGFSGGGQLNDTPTRAIYSQYALLCDVTHPDWENVKINKGNVLAINNDSSTYTKNIFWAPSGINDSNITTKDIQDKIKDIMNKPPRFIDLDGGFFDDVYIINISNKRLRDRLDPGNWELALAKLDTHTTIRPHESGDVITLVDDSLDANQDALINKKVDAFYGIYSGSISNGIHSRDKHYGYVYPNLGIIVLGASKLDEVVNFNTNKTVNFNGNNAFRLFTSISASATPIGARTKTYSFDARNVTYKTTTHYFLRANNKEFNYSNNPTFRSGSLDELRHPTFSDDPKTYITTIGLYNKYFELIAVAKVSKPILKSFVNEMSVVVKLEY